MDTRRTLLRAAVAGVAVAAAIALVVVTRSDDAPVQRGGVDPAAAEPGTSAGDRSGGEGAAAGGARDDHGRDDGRGHRGGDVPETIALPPGLQPEGVTSDGASTFYVGSLADGRVVTGDLRTGDTEVLVPGEQGRVAVGTLYEPRHDRLWVAGGPTEAVTVYDADTGEQLGRWVTPGSVFLNDVAVTSDAAYVTDSGRQHLVVVPLGEGGELPAADGATTLDLTGDFSVVPGDFNANGIRALGDDTLVLVQGNAGTLFLVESDTGVTSAVEERGGELVGGDGLELGAGRLFVVRGGGDNTVAVVNLRRGGRVAEVERVVRDEDFDVPTTATFAAGRLWTVNARFGTEPAPTTEYDLVRVDFR